MNPIDDADETVNIAIWLIIATVLLAALTGCNADIASPFDKPDETAQPVQCDAGCTK